MQSLTEAFGRAVRVLREQTGVSQEAFAYAAQIDRAFMSRIERGKSNVSLGTVERIASALGLPLDALFAEVERQRSLTHPTGASRST
jgi:transcriptional regulator with XRE-family HTH domain